MEAIRAKAGVWLCALHQLITGCGLSVSVATNLDEVGGSQLRVASSSLWKECLDPKVGLVILCHPPQQFSGNTFS